MASSGTNGTKAEILGTYAAQLGGIGTLPGGYEMKIDESATPLVHPPRRIPYMLKDKVKAELCWMEEMGIITKVGNLPSGSTQYNYCSGREAKWRCLYLP